MVLLVKSVCAGWPRGLENWESWKNGDFEKIGWKSWKTITLFGVKSRKSWNF